MSNPFNNQINSNNIYGNSCVVKKRIVAQLRSQSVEQQEATIEMFLRLLDVNILATLALAYGCAGVEQSQEGGQQQ